MLRAGNQEERYAPGQTVILQPGRKRQNRSGSADKNMLEGLMYPSSMQEAACPCYALGTTVAETNQTLCNTTR